MLMSAKFSCHLNKAYSITAGAGSSKLVLEEKERGLFSLKYGLQGERDEQGSLLRAGMISSGD